MPCRRSRLGFRDRSINEKAQRQADADEMNEKDVKTERSIKDI